MELRVGGRLCERQGVGVIIALVSGDIKFVESGIGHDDVEALPTTEDTELSHALLPSDLTFSVSSLLVTEYSLGFSLAIVEDVTTWIGWAWELGETGIDPLLKPSLSLVVVPSGSTVLLSPTSADLVGGISSACCS